MAKRREIRNSTAEFLIFQAEAKEQGVEVYYKDGTTKTKTSGPHRKRWLRCLMSMFLLSVSI